MLMGACDDSCKGDVIASGDEFYSVCLVSFCVSYPDKKSIGDVT